MTNKKSYTTPVWWLAIIIFLTTALTIMSIVAVFRVTPAQDIDADFYQRLNNQIISKSTVLLLLLVEAIIYWKIRRSPLQKKLVWWHLAGWIMFEMILPAIFYALTTWLAIQEPENSILYIRRFMTLQNTIGLAAMGIGHICFVLVLVDVYKKRKDQRSSIPAEGPDILNDYA